MRHHKNSQFYHYIISKVVLKIFFNVKSAKYLWNQIILVLEMTLHTTFGYKGTTEPITI